MVCLPAVADSKSSMSDEKFSPGETGFQERGSPLWWRAAVPNTFEMSLEAVSEPAETLRCDFKRESEAWPKPASGSIASGGCHTGQTVDKLSRFTGVAWLMQVHSFYRGSLSHRALFLATSLLDRYLFWSPPHENMQLLAAASLLIASKMEDEVPICLKHLRKHAGCAFTQEELKLLERKILTTLDFDVEAVTAAEFVGNFVAAWRVANDLKIMKFAELSSDVCTDFDLDYLMRAAWAYAATPSDEDRRRWNGTWHLAILSLLDKELLDRCKPSEIAAASLLLSNRHLRLEEPWGKAMTNITGYTESSLEPCVATLERLRVSRMPPASGRTSPTSA
jgi:hypothetical protein